MTVCICHRQHEGRRRIGSRVAHPGCIIHGTAVDPSQFPAPSDRYKSNHQCRICSYWLEGDWSGADEDEQDKIHNEMLRGICDLCWERMLTNAGMDPTTTKEDLKNMAAINKGVDSFESWKDDQFSAGNYALIRDEAVKAAVWIEKNTTYTDHDTLNNATSMFPDMGARLVSLSDQVKMRNKEIARLKAELEAAESERNALRATVENFHQMAGQALRNL